MPIKIRFGVFFENSPVLSRCQIHYRRAGGSSFLRRGAAKKPTLFTRFWYVGLR
jgi:hypothetical protein